MIEHAFRAGAGGGGRALAAAIIEIVSTGRWRSLEALRGETEPEAVLRTVPGIGPKLALAMLSGLRVGDICQAISSGDIKRLTTLPGVGKRTAERICVDLKEKVSHLVSGTISSQGGGSTVVAVEGSAAADAISALMNLGYADGVARAALAKVKKQLGEEDFSTQKVEVLIREALRALA